MKRTFAALLVLISTPMTIAYAAETDPPMNDTSSPMLFFKLIAYFGIVLLLLYIFFQFVLKKNKMVKSNTFDHLGGISLGQNKTLQAVEIGNKIYILGVGENITLVNVVETEEDKESIKNTIDTSYNQNNSLASLIERIGTKFKKKKQKNSFEKELTEKIEQMKDRRFQHMNQLLDENEELQEKRDRNDE